MSPLDNYEHNDHGRADNVHDIRHYIREDYFDNTNQERTDMHKAPMMTTCQLDDFLSKKVKKCHRKSWFG